MRNVKPENLFFPSSTTRSASARRRRAYPFSGLLLSPSSPAGDGDEARLVVTNGCDFVASGSDRRSVISPEPADL